MQTMSALVSAGPEPHARGMRAGLWPTPLALTFSDAALHGTLLISASPINQIAVRLLFPKGGDVGDIFSIWWLGQVVSSLHFVALVGLHAKISSLTFRALQ